jgi:predicted outer membrane lipoprotein
MPMTTEELAPSRRAALAAGRVARDFARWAGSHRLTPISMAGISAAFAVIAAVWLTGGTARAEGIAFAALLASYVVGRVGYLMGQRVSPATEWARAACGSLTEFVVYAGIAGGASLGAAARADAGLTGPAGSRLRGTWVAGFEGASWVGVWRLAVAAVIVLALVQMADLCRPVIPGEARQGWFSDLTVTTGGGRLLLAGAVVLLAGARVTFLLLIVLGVLGLGAIAGSRSRFAWPRVLGYRDDGPVAVWIGQFVNGRLPALPPLVVGLLVTGMLVALGLQNLPGILAFTPVEAMLLASLASWHPHDGPRDWLGPPLLVAGECVYLAALGFAGRVPPPATFALVAAVALHHLDLAYRARNELVPSETGPLVREEGQLPYSDRTGFGWDGRLIIAGLAAVGGAAPAIYPLLALYLCGLLARDWLADWSAGHAAVNS